MFLFDQFIHPGEETVSVVVGAGYISFFGVASAATQREGPAFFIETSRMGHHRPMAIVAVGVGITDARLSPLFAGARIDVGVGADVSEGEGIGTESDRQVAVAEDIVESAPESEGREAVVEVLHRDAVQPGAKKVLVVPPNPEADGAEIEGCGGEEGIPSSRKYRGNIGSGAVTHVIVIDRDHGDVVQDAVPKLVERAVDRRQRVCPAGLCRGPDADPRQE